MKKRFLYLILPVLTVLLESLPYGVVLNFATPEGEPLKKTYSYFSLTPYGYASFSPFFTAVITSAVALILLFYCINGKRALLIIARNTLFLGSIISICPLFLGIDFFSPIGGLITFLLVAESALISFKLKREAAQRRYH